MRFLFAFLFHLTVLHGHHVPHYVNDGLCSDGHAAPWVDKFGNTHFCYMP